MDGPVPWTNEGQSDVMLESIPIQWRHFGRVAQDEVRIEGISEVESEVLALVGWQVAVEFTELLDLSGSLAVTGVGEVKQLSLSALSLPGCLGQISVETVGDCQEEIVVNVGWLDGPPELLH
jgi:hypothetical protein